jgi:hypothetical protein
MKIKLLTAAVIAAAANSAYSLDLYISGATAQDKGLRASIVKLCAPNAVVSYTDDISKLEGSGYAVHSCTLGAAAGTLNGTPVRVFKRSAGGSAWGVGPVEAKDSIDFLDPTSPNCVASGANFDCAYDHDANATTAKIVDKVSVPTEAGISDLAPEAFKGINLLVPGVGGVAAGDPGTSALTTAQLARLDVDNMAALTFGVIATKGLRDRLQTAQGLITGSDDEAQMPSLSRAQVRSLMAGNIKTWAEFKVNVAGVATALDDATLNTTAGANGALATNGVPSNNRVTICRRTQGSGTQAQTNLYVYDQPCNTLYAPLGDNTSTTPTKSDATTSFTALAGFGNATVHWNEGSGDVDNCMVNLQTNSRWALGIQSLEKGKNEYRFIKLDNASPIGENVANGSYQNVAFTTMQWIKSSEANGLAGDKLTLATTIRTALGNATDLGGFNVSFNPRINGYTGKVGFLGLKANGETLTIPFDSTKPVTPLINKGTGATDKPNVCYPMNIQGGSSEI